MEDQIQAKVQKLVALVIRGVGGEKDNAERFLRSLCKKHEIEYDDLFREKEKKIRYYARVADHRERKVFKQVLARYAGIKEIWGSRKDHTAIGYETTPTLYLEVMGIWEVLKRQYRIERKKMNEGLVNGFIQKHELFRKKEEDEESRRPTEAEIRAYWAGVRAAGGMDDVELRKQLKQ
jgi:hypothetical protein